MVVSEDESTIIADDESGEDDAGPWQRARLAIGVVGILAIGHRIYAAEEDISNAQSFDPSAIQIIQIWTPHLFYMMAIIGAMIAFYVMSRSDS